jgi:hypothetical protein
MQFVNRNIKNIIIKSVSYGFVSGFCIGCFPNEIYIKFEDKNYKKCPPIPLITGLICSIGLIFSPLLITNYFCNGVYFDKLIDKYNINIERYHQYDCTNNKYAYPSVLILRITSKKRV